MYSSPFSLSWSAMIVAVLSFVILCVVVVVVVVMDQADSLHSLVP